jgi:hypothetical protein
MSAESEVDPVLQPLLLCEEDGREVLNAGRAKERGIWLRARDYPLVVAAGASKTTFFIAAPAVDGGDAEIETLTAESNVPFLCELTDPANLGGLPYQNAPVHHNLMFGRGGRPFELARSILVPAAEGLKAEITSRASALASDIRLVAGGRWFPPGVPKKAREAVRQAFGARGSRPFWLTDDGAFVVLDADGEDEVIMTMPQGLRLVGASLMGESTGPFEAEVFDFENGNRFTMGGPIESSLLCGHGGAPCSIHGLLQVEPKQRVQVKLTDRSGASNVVFLAFHGPALPKEAVST